MNQFGRAVGTIALAAALSVLPAVGNTNTSEVGATETTRITRTERPAPTQVAETGIRIGEWELEGPTMFDILFVYIDPDPYGIAEEFIDEVDPLDFAVETGFQYIGESRVAPDGCRLFSYSGPMNIPMFVAFCSGNDYILIAGGTDKDVLDKTMEDFADGKPFSIPRGYTRS